MMDNEIYKKVQCLYCGEDLWMVVTPRTTSEDMVCDKCKQWWKDNPPPEDKEGKTVKKKAE